MSKILTMIGVACMRLPAFLLLAAGLLVGGCAQQVGTTAVLKMAPETPYTLASGDRLRVIVFGQDNLSNIYPVDASGRIAMPLIGPVTAAGTTTRDLERTIEAKLRAGFIREPKVTVDIDTYRPFFILGEVLNAGQFPFVPGMTVQTAAAIAGGFSPRAVQATAEITRQVKGRTVVAIVPATYPVQPGDTIVIKERWF